MSPLHTALLAMAAAMLGAARAAALLGLAAPPAPSRAAARSPLPLAPSAPSYRMEEELAGVKLDIEMMRIAMADVGRSLSSRAPSPAPTSPPSEPGTAAPPSSPAETRRQQERQIGLLEDFLDHGAEDARFDGQLALDVEATLHEREVAGAALREARCGGDLCRLHFDLQQPAVSNPALTNVLQTCPGTRTGTSRCP